MKRCSHEIGDASTLRFNRCLAGAGFPADGQGKPVYLKRGAVRKTRHPEGERGTPMQSNTPEPTIPQSGARNRYSHPSDRFIATFSF
jgi:hypothetical protein